MILTCGPALAIGRTVGWRLSKAILYTGTTAQAFAICLLWGGVLALLIRLTIDWLNPGTIVRVIGFGAAAYVSIPNYGLFAEASIPRNAYRRHRLVTNLPIVIFILGSFALVYVPIAFLGILVLPVLIMLGALAWKIVDGGWKAHLIGRSAALAAFVLSRRKASQTHNATRASFPLGEYKLDALMEGLVGFAEFSEAEYTLMGREFKGERNYNGPPVEFLGRSWKLQLGTVHGKIYKIAPYIEGLDSHEAGRIGVEVLCYCREKLGEPSEQKTGLPWGTEWFFWHTIDGNVILQTVEVGASFSVNLFVTSRSVANFK
jgi:hypothetical protein